MSTETHKKRIIFVNLKQLHSYSNVKINFHSLKKEDNVLNVKKTKLEKHGYANYFSIIRNPENNMVYMYYCNDTSNPIIAKTCIATSPDGIHFSRPKIKKYEYGGKKNNNIILDVGVSSTNLFPFYDENPNIDSEYKWKAIGGLHLSLWNIKEYMNKHPEKDKYFEIAHHLNYINIKPSLNLVKPEDVYNLPHPAFIRYWKSFKKKRIPDSDNVTMFLYIDSKEPSPFGGNGIMAYQSTNGLDWHTFRDTPIISGMHPGHYDKLYTCSHYDCHPCCFWDRNQNHYKIYLRSNINYGVRHIQYATSSDLTNWSPLQYVNISPKFNMKNDNYYSACCQMYPDSNVYIGFPPYYQNKGNKSFIALMVSLDGVNWNIVNQLIKGEKISSFSVGGFIYSNDETEMYIYEHFNRSKILGGKVPSGITRYSIRADGLSSITSHGNTMGNFEVDKIKIKGNIYINFKTKKDGHIKVEIRNNKNKPYKKATLKKCNALSGDSIKTEIKWNNMSWTDIKLDGVNGYMYFEMKNAEIFSIIFEE